MKRIYLFLLSSLLLINNSCVKNEEGEDIPSASSEYLNATNVDIAGDQTSATISIKASDNCSWSLTCSESWISSISPSSGRGTGEAVINTSVNPSSSAQRSATIKVRNSDGSIERSITFTQYASKEVIDLSVSTMDFASNAETRQVTVTSNTHWVITGGANWVTISPTEGDNNGDVSISIKENTTIEERATTLTFTGKGGTTKQLSIKQAGATYTTLSVPQITDITKNSANVSFTFDSSMTVTSYGVCYATTDDPTVENATNISQQSSSNQGSPTIALTDLTAGTAYYVRVYVFNADGIKYSNSVSFTTANSWPGGDDNNRPNI